MRVLVCGGRDFTDYDLLRRTLFKIMEERSDPLNLTIIQGEAKGADRLAKKWAKQQGINCVGYPADWYDMSPPCYASMRGTRPYNKLAGINRNQRMIDEGKPDLVIAFQGGKGTSDMITRAAKAGIEVIRVGEKNNKSV